MCGLLDFWSELGARSRPDFSRSRRPRSATPNSLRFDGCMPRSIRDFLNLGLNT